MTEYDETTNIEFNVKRDIKKQLLQSMIFTLKNLSFTFKTSRYNTLDLSSSSTFYANHLTIHKTNNLKPLPSFDSKTLGFGLSSSDHMAVIDYDHKKGWGRPSIVPLERIPVHPFNSSLHYAVQCFEGMKAYKNQKGQIRMFRPESNMKRLKESSFRIALPDFDGNQFLKVVQQFVKLQARWIPPISQFSLYLRPLHISMQNSLGVKSPRASKLMILGSPVGPYYPSGFTPISLDCSNESIRSAPGGTGSYNVGGNYGPILDLEKRANEKGHHQIIWLYGDEIIEVGSSNIFFIFKSEGNKVEVVTPELRDMIFPGITRDSIIRLLRAKDEYIVTERKITIQEVLQRNKKGELIECFSSGTAEVIGSVKNISYKGNQNRIYINEDLRAGEHTYKIRQQLLDIQEGRAEDKFGWVKLIR